jgi:hypothetical protein
VLREKATSWYQGVSPPSHQAWLDLLLATLKKQADRGLTAGCVLTNLHHRRIVPLMERRLRIFEMSEDADPVALAESRLLRDLFPWQYAATRARRAIDLRPGIVMTRPCGNSLCSPSANWQVNFLISFLVLPVFRVAGAF